MELTAQKRTALGKGVAPMRAAGEIPAVVYGPKQESTSITLNRKDFEKVFKAAGESTVVKLIVDGDELTVLVHDVDYDPVTNVIRHADFYAVVKGQKVEVMIPLEFVGESAAVKAGANLVKTLYEIEVEAEATNLPHGFEVDISVLTEVGAQILAGDIKMPAGVTLVTNPEEVIALTAAAVEEELDTPVVGPDMAAIGDSVERGKADEEVAEGGEEAKAE